MTDNKYKGWVEITIGDKVMKVCFDWNALAELNGSYTTEQIQEAISKRKLKDISEILLVGLKKHQPDITMQTIQQASPPVLEAVNAVDRAIMLAYYGPEKADEVSKALIAAMKNNPAFDAKKKDFITEALRISFICGVSPDVFWEMTPWQWRECIKAFHHKAVIEYREDYNKHMTIAWYNAGLSRSGARKLPDIKEFLMDENPDEDDNSVQNIQKGVIVDENAIKAQMRQYQRLKNDHSRKS